MVDDATPRVPRAIDGNPARLVTLAEAAGALAVSVRTVRRWGDYGYLDVYRVGPRALRVSVGDVNRLIARLPAHGHDDREDT